MKNYLFACAALLLAVGVVGCSKKTETETVKQTEVTSPGGTTTVTETTTIEQTGKNPPPANP